MSAFLLVPGAGGNASYWTRLAAELTRRGHVAVGVDLPEDDPSLDLAAWAALVDAATPPGDAVIGVFQSLGGFLAPLVRTPLRAIVLLNAMIPAPGESPDEWWGATGSGEAMRANDLAAGRDPEFDLDRHFFHDLDDDARAELLAEEPREPSAKAMASAAAFDRWPDVPIHVLAGRDDRFFPLEFQRRIARERLGLDVDEVPGGHLVAVSNPSGIADRLETYAAG